jgi:hypothetical protein
VSWNRFAEPIEDIGELIKDIGKLKESSCSSCIERKLGDMSQSECILE